MQIFTDEGVGFLLDRIDSDEYACLVFASNALLSGQVERALARHREQLQEYLRRGGGLVVLHQLADTLASLLPDDLCPEQAERVAQRGTARAQAHDPDDVLLHFPVTVDVDALTDGGARAGPPSLFFKGLTLGSLPQKLKLVLSHGNEGLVARTYDHLPERVVVATPPLDWQHSAAFLANLIRFASVGAPRRLVWQTEENSRPELLRRWLSIDGRTSIRTAPPDGEPIDPVDAWLLDTVDIFVIPPDQMSSAENRPEVRRFLAHGGSLIATDRATHLQASRITALVGNHTERMLATRLQGELRAVRGWETIQYAFELRNIVTVLALLSTDRANRSSATVELDSLGQLRLDIRERLQDPIHQEDLSSSIALAQILFLLSHGRLDRNLITWMERDPRRAQFEVGLQIRAVTALSRRQRDDEYLVAVHAELTSRRAELNSLAAVVRLLDSVAMLDQVGLLDPHAPGAAELAELVCSLLEEYPPNPRAGWMSVEATAELVRGLVVLYERIDSDDELSARVAEHIGTGVAVLRQAFRRYERNRKGVAWLARLIHAIVLAERRFPLGLQRFATLEWPEAADEDAPARTVPQSLLEHLASENGELRLRQEEFAHQRLAAKLGRGTATTLATVAAAAPFAWLITVVGFTSVWTLIGNLAIIALLPLAVLTGLYTLLAREHLLARPADAARRWLGAAVPLLARITGGDTDRAGNLTSR